jgi:voltage-dependent potassium channel beta subunit
MKYNRLGKAGIKISELSFGSWVTFSNQMNIDEVRQCMHTAFEHGINFFDNAEVYAKGQAEILMGKALKDFRREDLVISTKIFWGGDGPNDKGLSRKHLLEGTEASLDRLQLDYVDLIFCHRPDPDTPIEETVLAMDYIIRNGFALYWGTSEWSAEQIEAAYVIAKDLGCMPPSMEQPEYNMFHRQRVEQEYAPLYEKYGLGTTIWSPLASGILTGKYNNGIPPESRLAQENWLVPQDFEQRVAKAKQLSEVAQNLDCSMSQLALAWCLKNPRVSTVIMGASKVTQLLENLKATEIKEQLTDEVMAEIEAILA